MGVVEAGARPVPAGRYPRHAGGETRSIGDECEGDRADRRNSWQGIFNAGPGGDERQYFDGGRECARG